jgi:hypothetical protein
MSLAPPHWARIGSANWPRWHLTVQRTFGTTAVLPLVMREDLQAFRSSAKRNRHLRQPSPAGSAILAKRWR